MDLQAPLGNLSATQKDQLMTEVRQQIAVANAQELVTVSSISNLSYKNNIAMATVRMRLKQAELEMESKPKY